MCNEFIVNYPLVIKETCKYGLDLRPRNVCFFRPRWILCFPLHALSFCFRVIMKTPRLMTGNCVKDQMKCEADTVSGHVSRFEASFLWTFFSFPNLPLQSVTLFPYSYSILSHTYSSNCAHQGLYSVHICICPLVFGCLLLGSSCTSYPSLIRLCHSKTLNLFIAYSPQTTVNRAKLSLAPLPIFTQNLMFIRSSRFLSLIFPPTVYQGHVLLPLLLGNKWLIWSVAHINAIWNMSKHAWVHEFASLNTPAMRCDYSGN